MQVLLFSYCVIGVFLAIFSESISLFNKTWNPPPIHVRIVFGMTWSLAFVFAMIIGITKGVRIERDE